MRRMTAMLTLWLSAAAGCRGGAAQEPYDGVIVAAQRHADPAATTAPQAAELLQMASGIDVPWSIALLSNAKTATARKPAKVLVVEAEREATDPDAHDLDLQLASDPTLADEKPTTPKTCNGVVIRRS
jgi:glucose/arabinose dehydrogenase